MQGIYKNMISIFKNTRHNGGYFSGRTDFLKISTTDDLLEHMRLNPDLV